MLYVLMCCSTLTVQCVYQVVASGRRKSFYIYDLAASRVERVQGIMGRQENSFESFVTCPSSSNPLIAFLGNEGCIPLLSLKSRQSVGTLKMNGTVRTAAFTASGQELLTAGAVLAICNVLQKPVHSRDHALYSDSCRLFESWLLQCLTKLDTVFLQCHQALVFLCMLQAWCLHQSMAVSYCATERNVLPRSAQSDV